VLAGLTLAGTPLDGDGVAMLGFGLSLWMTLLFGTCVAHELEVSGFLCVRRFAELIS
jgi:hypothetical protein